MPEPHYNKYNIKMHTFVGGRRAFCPHVYAIKQPCRMTGWLINRRMIEHRSVQNNVNHRSDITSLNTELVCTNSMPLFVIIKLCSILENYIYAADQKHPPDLNRVKKNGIVDRI